MIITTNPADPRVVQALRQGGLVVLRTDTIYGIVAQAADPHAIARLYQAKQRAAHKSCIVLVSGQRSIPGLTLDQQRQYMTYNQQQPTTVIVPADDMLPDVPRQNNTLAFRAVSKGALASLIDQAGPLLAPSANPAGLPPANNIAEAIDYFGDTVSTYVDEGESSAAATPSRIIRFDGNDAVIVRY